MIIRNFEGKTRLAIFENFRVDNNLLKHKNEESLKMSDGSVMMSNPESWSDNSFNIANGTTDSGSNYKPTLKERFVRFLLRILDGKNEERRTKKVIGVKEFFISLASSFKELTPVAEIGEHYDNAISQAKVLGQTSLVEKLSKLLHVVKGETILIQMNLKKYVTEQQVIDFYKKVGEDSSLKLTWIKNFVKIIPSDVVEVKDSVDERKIFDNYVILHYDPNDDATDLTEKEKEIRKDPILFGVIQNSNKLYYIGDWIDDYCDLTLDKMFEELGEKVLEVNNKSLKTYINKAGEYHQRRKKLPKDNDTLKEK